MAQLFQRKVALLAMVETTYGTDPVPTGATNAMLVQNVKLTPLNGGTVKRPLLWPYFGAVPQIQVNTNVKLDFDVEVAGAGAAGTAAPYGPLLQSCGMSQTLTASVSAVYQPVSASISSATIYFYQDGQFHKLTGARGTVSFNFKKAAIPIMTFSFLGQYNAPSSVANPTLTLTGFQTPLPCNTVNTPTFTLQGFACVAESLTVDLANTLIYRAMIGQDYALISDRDPKGKASIEAPALATQNFFTSAKANTTGALALTHGTTAGNIVQIAAPVVQVFNPAYAYADGVVMLGMDLSFQPNAGNDELVITVK